MSGSSARDKEAAWVGFLAARGSAIVTATHRQAARVLAVHAEHRRAQGYQGWSRPQVARWDGWVASLCNAASARGVLPPVIDATQSRMLWMHVMSDWETGNVERLGARALVSREATVEAAMRSWSLWLEAGLSAEELPLDGSEESACLRAWAGEYRARLAARGLVDAPLALRLLVDVLAPGHLGGLERLRLLGFLELTPARRALLARLGELGVVLEDVPPEGVPVLPPPPFAARHAAEPESEMREAVLWARERLANDPACRVAIVVPDIDARAPDLLRILDETLQPSRRFQAPEAGAGSTPPPIHDLAWTPSLATFPAIADGLTLLGLDHAPAPAARWTQLLLSPCLSGAAEELAARVAVDDALRRVPEPWPWQVVLRAARGAQILAGILDAVTRLHPFDAAERLPASQWAARFQTRLATAGWPGHSSDPALFQAAERLVAQLEALASLDALLPPLGPVEALAHLRALVQAQRFRPRSRPCRLDVVPLDEVPGMAWDAVWVTGLTAASFPQPVRPPPFLSAPASRERALPGTAPAQLAGARRWLAALAAAAPVGVVSAPVAIGDEQHELAPLAREWLGRPQAPAGLAAGLPAIALEPWQDARAPTLPSGRHPGSRTLLRDQAECPFRAWARHRVRAKPPREPALRVDARQRGEWLHAALAALWQAIGDSYSLAAANDAGKVAWIEEAVRAGLLRMGQVDPALPRSRFARLEAERLRALLASWLTVEGQRSVPFRVEQVEQDIPCHVGTLDLTLRPDRSDRLEDGRRVVVDYKTGRVKLGEWFPPRLRDPQAALYALAAGDDSTAAVLMAQLDPKQPKMVGVASDPALREALGLGKKPSKGEPDDFATLLEQWREALLGLADDYQQGDARVAPMKKACEYCDVGPLCRIDRTLAEARDEAAEEEAEGEGDTDE
jgi:ATP-dependent helicase/nuclease subunit B